MSAPIALYNHPDRQLIRRSCSGDAGSFCLLVRPYERAMYMIALSMAASPAEAEQIAQDGALRAYQTLSQFRGDEPFDLWLIRVTCSVARDALRKRDPLGHESGSMSLRTEDTAFRPDLSPWREIPVESLGNKAIRDLIAAAIEALPVRLRAVFVLRDVLKQSMTDSAQVLEIDVDELKSRLNQARLRMRDQLAPLGNALQRSVGRAV